MKPIFKPSLVRALLLSLLSVTAHAQALIGYSNIVQTTNQVIASSSSSFDSIAAQYYVSSQAEVQSAHLTWGNNSKYFQSSYNYTDPSYPNYPRYLTTSSVSYTLPLPTSPTSFFLVSSHGIWNQISGSWDDTYGQVHYGYFDPCNFSNIGLYGSYVSSHVWYGQNPNIGNLSNYSGVTAGNTTMSLTTSPSLYISPNTYTLPLNGTIQFYANGTITGGDTNRSWSVSGGTIDQFGFYTAPNTPGNYSITLTTTYLGTTYTAAATVTILNIQNSGLYRYFNPTSGQHFYTTNLNELSSGSQGYSYEKTEGFVYPITNRPSDSVPFYRYRMANAPTGHFYTTDWNELGNGNSSWIYEGIQCYVYSTNIPGTTRLYRYRNTSNGDHFYSITQTNASGYTLEPMLIYVMTQPIQ